MNIPNLITLIRNAIKANKPKIIVKTSKKTLNFLEVLVQNRYILTYSHDSQKKIHIYLDFTVKKNKILSFIHLSKSSRPFYFSCQDLKQFECSLGLIILNTSKGIISHKTALKKGLGGEALCYIL